MKTSEVVEVGGYIAGAALSLLAVGLAVGHRLGFIPITYWTNELSEVFGWAAGLILMLICAARIAQR